MTKHYCDRCKKEQTTKMQVINIDVTYVAGQMFPTNSYELCDPCSHAVKQFITVTLDPVSKSK